MADRSWWWLQSNFRFDFEKVETHQMDATLYMIELISSPIFRDLENDLHFNYNISDPLKLELTKFHKFMSTECRMLPLDQKQAIIEVVRRTAHRVGNLMSEIVERKTGSSNHAEGGLVQVWETTVWLIYGMMSDVSSKHPESELEFENFCYFEVEQMYDNMMTERVKIMLRETTDSSNIETLDRYQAWVCRPLFYGKAFRPFEHIPNFKYKCYSELGTLPWLIYKLCERQPLAILLIGGLLSLKPIAFNTWNRVKDDLIKIKESNNCVTNNHMWHIINYCYEDLPDFLKLCFLYFACYPIGYEIPATSLINLWIVEGFVTPGQGEWVAKRFVTPEKEETREEIANKYLEQLVQRSLVCVSKRSILGTIKSFRVPRPIHEFIIQQSYMDEFLVANPDQEKIDSLFRLAMHHDNKRQYTEVKNNHIHSFLAFSFDRNVLGSAVLLRVLELRKSAIPTTLPNMISLKYLGLRGSNISELPKNIGDMKYLQTLDVRDTSIETLPESLWNIKELRHVYVKPSLQTKGPPSAAHIDNLHTLKTVAAHESWVENIPHFLIHLTKFALTNWENLDWKSISNLLSHMDKLISMAIMGKIIPSEFADIRAFPNLETMKSIKLEGEWNCRKLPIDNVKFPPNLRKLTLTNSGLKEDPMPTLERLQALKFLSLQDGAYTGKQMVCSANGFPQLQFLKLKKLENLENWVVQPGAMCQLTTLRVVQCRKLNNPSNLPVIITDIDD